jgi:hypothetical protein
MLERVKGIKPSPQNSQASVNQQASKDGETAYTQIRTQIQGNDGRDLSHVVEAWPGLPAAFKVAILAIVNSTLHSGGVS